MSPKSGGEVFLTDDGLPNTANALAIKQIMDLK
jgi:hypothetical protein